MLRTMLGLTLLASSFAVMAEDAHGVWKTEAGDSGGYLEVTIGPCGSDPKLTCGIISNAFSKEGPDSQYKNLGKLMISDMKPRDDSSYAGGTIWDPEKDKTYKSKMSVKGDQLHVSGCIAFFCTGQDWTRVQ